MLSTDQYLDQLFKDKEALINNLLSKGVDVSSDETFTTLVPKVNNIEASGGNIVDIVQSEIEQYVNGFSEIHINNTKFKLDISLPSSVSYSYYYNISSDKTVAYNRSSEGLSVSARYQMKQQGPLFVKCVQKNSEAFLIRVLSDEKFSGSNSFKVMDIPFNTSNIKQSSSIDTSTFKCSSTSSGITFYYHRRKGIVNWAYGEPQEEYNELFVSSDDWMEYHNTGVFDAIYVYSLDLINQSFTILYNDYWHNLEMGGAASGFTLVSPTKESAFVVCGIENPTYQELLNIYNSIVSVEE